MIFVLEYDNRDYTTEIKKVDEDGFVHFHNYLRPPRPKTIHEFFTNTSTGSVQVIESRRVHLSIRGFIRGRFLSLTTPL